MNLVLGLDFPLENPLDTTYRRLGSKVYPVYGKELECMIVNILWRCEECMHNSRDLWGVGIHNDNHVTLKKGDKLNCLLLRISSFLA
jgi:hypothetical protein